MFERLTTQAMAMEHRQALASVDELTARAPRPVRTAPSRNHFLRLPEKSEISRVARRAVAEHVSGN